MNIRGLSSPKCKPSSRFASSFPPCYNRILTATHVNRSDPQPNLPSQQIYPPKHKTFCRKPLRSIMNSDLPPQISYSIPGCREGPRRPQLQRPRPPTKLLLIPRVFSHCVQRQTSFPRVHIPPRPLLVIRYFSSKLFCFPLGVTS